MTESKESSGAAKYAILGLLLFGGSAALLVFALGGEEPPPSEPTPAPAAQPTKPTPALSAPTFVVPDEEEDAGATDAAVPAPEPRKRPRARRPRGPCEGEVPAREAAKVVRKHRPQVRTCYERRLKVNNLLQGRLVLRLRVGRRGEVESVQVGGSLRDREVAACVRKLARQWQFPKPKGGCALVEAPFNLRPKP